MDTKLQKLLREWDANPGDLDLANKLIACFRKLEVSPDGSETSKNEKEITLDQLEDALSDVRLNHHTISPGPKPTAEDGLQNLYNKMGSSSERSCYPPRTNQRNAPSECTREHAPFRTFKGH